MTQHLHKRYQCLTATELYPSLPPVYGTEAQKLKEFHPKASSSLSKFHSKNPNITSIAPQKYPLKTHTTPKSATMPKESTDPVREKKDKKDKKRKHSESAPPIPDEVEIVAERKKKDKSKKRKSSAEDADGDVVVDAGQEMEIVKDESEEEKKAVVHLEVPLAALVPFANPLCDDKALKKVLKGVKKGKIKILPLI